MTTLNEVQEYLRKLDYSNYNPVVSKGQTFYNNIVGAQFQGVLSEQHGQLCADYGLEIFLNTNPELDGTFTALLKASESKRNPILTLCIRSVPSRPASLSVSPTPISTVDVTSTDGEVDVYSVHPTYEVATIEAWETPDGSLNIAQFANFVTQQTGCQRGLAEDGLLLATTRSNDPNCWPLYESKYDVVGNEEHLSIAEEQLHKLVVRKLGIADKNEYVCVEFTLIRTHDEEDGDVKTVLVQVWRLNHPDQIRACLSPDGQIIVSRQLETPDDVVQVLSLEIVSTDNDEMITYQIVRFDGTSPCSYIDNKGVFSGQLARLANDLRMSHGLPSAKITVQIYPRRDILVVSIQIHTNSIAPTVVKTAAIVTKPAAVVEQTTAKPAAVVEQTTVAKPAAVVEQTTVAKPTAIVTKPAAIVAKTAAVEEQTTIAKPAAIVTKPAAVEEQTTVAKPAAIVTKPAAVVTKPAAVVEQTTTKPAAIVTKPAAIVEQTTVAKPAAVKQTPTKPAAVKQTTTKPAIVEQTTTKPAIVEQTTAKPAAAAVIYGIVKIGTQEVGYPLCPLDNAENYVQDGFVLARTQHGKLYCQLIRLIDLA